MYAILTSQPGPLIASSSFRASTDHQKNSLTDKKGLANKRMMNVATTYPLSDDMTRK